MERSGALVAASVNIVFGMLVAWVLALKPDGNYGKGRYVLRITAPKLKAELAEKYPGTKFVKPGLLMQGQPLVDFLKDCDVAVIGRL